MRLTSMDILNKELSRSFRGYDCDEVDELLDTIAQDYETLYKENSQLKEKIVSHEEKIKHFEKIEETIQNTLVLAQNAAEQAKRSAEREAEIIIKNANDTSQKVIDKANSDVIKISDDYETLKQEFVMFRSKYKHFMKSQMEMFDELEKDFLKNYSVGSSVDEITFGENLLDENIQVKEVALDGIQEDEDAFGTSLDEIKSFFVPEE